MELEGQNQPLGLSSHCVFLSRILRQELGISSKNCCDQNDAEMGSENKTCPGHKQADLKDQIDPLLELEKMEETILPFPPSKIIPDAKNKNPMSQNSN